MEQLKRHENGSMDKEESNVLSHQSIDDLSKSVSELSKQVKEASAEATQQTIGFIKKYPIHSVLGAALLGFLAGGVSRRIKK